MPVRCSGITKAGVQCAKVSTRSLGEGSERQWCPLHAPEGAVKDIPSCAGKLRNGVGCPSAPVYIAVFGGEEVTLCSVHRGVFNDSDGKSVQTPPKPKKKPMTRIAQPSTVVEAVSTEEGNGKGSRHRESGTLRERLISSNEELCEYIHSALEDTIRNAQKRRMTACPSSGIASPS